MTRSARSGSAPQASTEKAVLAAAAATARRGGRPSQKEAARLGDRILDVATELFLLLGYGATSIEAVVQRARISKRTVYHRFEDKAVLRPKTNSYSAISFPPILQPCTPGYDCEHLQAGRIADVDR